MARRLAPLLQAVATAAPDAPPSGLLPPLKTALRSFRRREMVRIAVRDLAGISDLDDTMADLSALAAATIDVAGLPGPPVPAQQPEKPRNGS